MAPAHAIASSAVEESVRPMSDRKRKRRKDVMALVMERGAISVGALAEMLDVSMQTATRGRSAASIRRLAGSAAATRS